MGFLDSLLGRIPNENTSTPFHANKTPDERKDWFARTRPWHKVNPLVVDALEVPLGTAPVMYEVFVHVSMALDLVGAYERIDTGSNDATVIRTIVAGQLCMAASKASATFMTMKDQSQRLRGAELERQFNDAVKYAGKAMDAWESAVHIDRRMVAAYPGLAFFLMVMGKKEEGLKYAKQGLDQVRQVRTPDVPFHLSGVASVRDGAAHLRDLEQSLVMIIKDLEAL